MKLVVVYALLLWITGEVDSHVSAVLTDIHTEDTTHSHNATEDFTRQERGLPLINLDSNDGNLGDILGQDNVADLVKLIPEGVTHAEKVWKVMVIGAGSMGTACGCHLAQEESGSVLVLDNLGMLSPQRCSSGYGKLFLRSCPLPGTAKLLDQALSHWEGIERSSGLNLLLPIGEIAIFSTGSMEMHNFLQNAQTYNVDYKELDAEEAKRVNGIRVPVGFTAYSVDSYVLAPDALSALHQNAMKEGANMDFNNEVMSITQRPDEKTFVIETTNGNYRTYNVIMAVGGATSALLSKTVINGQAVHPDTTELKQVTNVYLKSTNPSIPCGGGRVVTVYNGTNSRSGFPSPAYPYFQTMRNDGETTTFGTRDFQPNADEFADASTVWNELCPDSNFRSIFSDTNTITVTESNTPAIRRICSGLYSVSGFRQDGMAVAPGVGEFMAGMITNGKHPLEEYLKLCGIYRP